VSDCEELSGGYLEGVWLWRISGGGQSHNWECDWPFLDCWFWMDISV